MNRLAELEKLLRDPALQASRQHFWEQAGMSEANYLRTLRTSDGLFNYIPVKTIGKGGFGEVKLVRRNQDGRLYALKRLVKTQMMVSTEALARVRTERDIMAECDSEWVVKLYATFHDNNSLYLLMEYLSGGDMIAMLDSFPGGRFPEHIARFYAAEIVAAIEAVHQLGYIHRDIKPDNMLLDREGHLKLVDFGISKSSREIHDRQYYNRLLYLPGPMFAVTKAKPAAILRSPPLITHSCAGTAGYTAPELVAQRRYSYEAD